MTSLRKVLGIAFTFVAGFGHVAQSVSAPAARPGEFVVKMRPAPQGHSSLQSLQQKLSIMGLEMKKEINAAEDVVLLKKTADLSDTEQLKKLRALDNVQYAEPNYIYHQSTLPVMVPNDAQFTELWGMQNLGQTVHGKVGVVQADIRAPEAWALHRGSGRVIVGIVDTGIDYTHPDLAANVWSLANNDAVHGYNAITDTLDPMDDASHGTHVSGTIGARGGNGVGVVGVNWNVKLMGCKFLGKDGSGSLSDAIKAIDWCVDHGAQVLNNSWGGGGYSEALKESIQRAGERGVLFIAAAGNESNDNDAEASYPASYDLPNVIAVGASTNLETIASFSNYGATQVHLMAPGEDIVSTIPGGGYESYSGTSMATPHVTGAAALLMSYDPSLDSVAVKNRLLSSTDKIRNFRNKVSTGGRLNLYNLLANINPAPFRKIPEESWITVAQTIATPHDYADGSDETWTVEQPGATHMKLHIAKLMTEDHFDRLTVTNAKSGEIVGVYSGEMPEGFWTPEIESDKVTLTFTSDTSHHFYGFDLDSYQWTAFDVNP